MPEKPKTYFEQQIARVYAQDPLRKYQYVQIRQSRAFIEKYHSEQIDLQKMTAAAFMSRYHYIKIFRQVYAVTPRQYLRDMRITKVKELLVSGLSVT